MGGDAIKTGPDGAPAAYELRYADRPGHARGVGRLRSRRSVYVSLCVFYLFACVGCVRGGGRSVRLCRTVAEIVSTPGPKVVLASTPSLDPGCGMVHTHTRAVFMCLFVCSYGRACVTHGATGAGRPALDLFLAWAADPRATVLFPSAPLPGSVAAQLLAVPRPPALVLRVRARPMSGISSHDLATLADRDTATHTHANPYTPHTHTHSLSLPLSLTFAWCAGAAADAAGGR
jgi:hypothetical protein